MKAIKHFIYVQIVSLYIVIDVSGQTPRFEQVKIFTNKTDFEINAIFQDQTGYIWFATTEGLVKHNGIDFIDYNLDSLFGNNVTAINQDTTGTLWLGHSNGGITHFKNNTFTAFKPEEGLSKEEISSFFIDSENTLWFSTLGEGFYLYSGDVRKWLYNLNSDD